MRRSELCCAVVALLVASVQRRRIGVMHTLVCIVPRFHHIIILGSSYCDRRIVEKTSVRIFIHFFD